MQCAASRSVGVEKLKHLPRATLLTEHVRRVLATSGLYSGKTVNVDILLNCGSGITSMGGGSVVDQDLVQGDCGRRDLSVGRGGLSGHRFGQRE